MRFLSTLVASILGTLIALGLLFLFGGLFIAMIAVSASGVGPRISDGTVLRMELSGAYPEHRDQTLADFSGSDGTLTVRRVVDALRGAAEDDRISALWLVSSGIEGSWAGLLEIHEAIEQFGDSGKPVYASTGPNGFTEATYFLSSAADSIFAVPEGGFQFDGFYMVVEFYRELLEKLDVRPQIVRAGKFKSAVEPFLRDRLSEENRLQLQVMVDRIDSVYTAQLARGRRIDAERVREVRAEAVPLSTGEAVELGLIDAPAYENEVVDRIKAALQIEEERLPTVSMEAYAGVAPEQGGRSGSNGTVAVYQAEGTITTGSGSMDPWSGINSIGHEPFVDAFESLRKDESVKAVVLRINSPGGAATASDAMWHAVARTAAEKPVVASFGGVAASGGYYIAAPAQHIVANPLSITGSIGAYGMFFNLGDAFESNLGISFDGVRSAPHADMFSGLRDLTSEERGFLAAEVDRTYLTFVQRVAEGRDLPEAKVDSVGQGRVWMGADAIGLGLADELGGLGTAIERAAALAELEPGSYRLRYLPRPKTIFEQVDAMLPNTLVRGLRKMLTNLPVPRSGIDTGAVLSRIANENGSVQLRLPVEIRVR